MHTLPLKNFASFSCHLRRWKYSCAISINPINFPHLSGKISINRKSRVTANRITALAGCQKMTYSFRLIYIYTTSTHRIPWAPPRLFPYLRRPSTCILPNPFSPSALSSTRSSFSNRRRGLFARLSRTYLCIDISLTFSVTTRDKGK